MRSDDAVIYIVGHPRSGTTMMGRILGGHPSVYTFQELHFFEKLSSTKNVRKKLSVTEAQELAERIICMQNDTFPLPRETVPLFSDVRTVSQEHHGGRETAFFD
jgi:hypothetical protein